MIFKIEPQPYQQNMKKKVQFIGLDVHKKTITVARPKPESD
jgi:hypothetical protein